LVEEKELNSSTPRHKECPDETIKNKKKFRSAFSHPFAYGLVFITLYDELERVTVLQK